MKDSGIEWTHHTFNGWVGCTKVSPGCQNCYALTLMETRYGRVRWGPGRPRSRTSADYWKQPLKWDREAAAVGERQRVFCASLADVFDPEVPWKWRVDLYRLIEATPHLDWLLLTKRPEHALSMVASIPHDHPNVWIGISVEDQERANVRIPLLRALPAAVRFLSVEPLLEAVRLDLKGIDWVIVGGESGPHSRAMAEPWVRSIQNQCLVAGVPFFFKQWGGTNKKAAGRLLDGRTWDEIPLRLP